MISWLFRRSRSDPERIVRWIPVRYASSRNYLTRSRFAFVALHFPGVISTRMVLERLLKRLSTSSQMEKFVRAVLADYFQAAAAFPRLTCCIDPKRTVG